MEGRIQSLETSVRRRAAATSLGHRYRRWTAPSVTSQIPAAVDTVRRRWPEVTADPPTDRPVFLFSSGWRSGSTLLQRLIVSGGDVFLWGEPHARCDLIRHLAESMVPFTDDYPRSEIVSDGQGAGGGELAGRWIGNLSPASTALVDAHRALLRRYLAPPSAAHGGDPLRWGIKEVRLGAEHAHYLRLLFPAAQFVFLHRDPYDQWRSYAEWRSWYERWPSVLVHSPRQFGDLWRRLTGGFVAEADALGAHVVRYDDLVNDPSTVEHLEAYLGTALDRGVLDLTLRGSVRAAPRPVPGHHARAMRRSVEPLASSLGYRGPSTQEDATITLDTHRAATSAPSAPDVVDLRGAGTGTAAGSGSTTSDHRGGP